MLLRNLVLQSVGLVGTLELRRLEHVPLVLLSVEMLEVEPEGSATNESDDSNDDVVPDEERVTREGGEGLADGGGKGGHEEIDRHDEGLHVVGGLGVGVLVRSDVGEDLTETDEDVRQTLSPDVDVGRLTTITVGILTAGALFINKMLHNRRRNHGESRDDETDCHTLDGGEGDTQLAEAGVKKMINEGNHDDDGDGVQVLNDIIGNTVELHGGGLSGEVTSHLVVGQMEDGQVKEDLAGHQATTDLIDPGIIISHPSRALVNRDLRGLGMLPVEAEERAALADVEEHAQELGEDGASGGLELVLLLVEGENDGSNEEEDSGDEEGEPE